MVVDGEVDVAVARRPRLPLRVGRAAVDLVTPPRQICPASSHPCGRAHRVGPLVATELPSTLAIEVIETPRSWRTNAR